MKFLMYALLLVFCGGYAQEASAVEASAQYQKHLDEEFADAEKSPLQKADLDAFHGLDFFAIDAKYIVTANLKRESREKPFEMKTTGNRRPLYAKYGELSFEVDGKPCKLNVYRNIELSKKEGYKDYLFLPFSDLTSGNESYIGGRYIELREPKGNTITIDFNRAFNPYCAYNPAYSCPIVPLENDLSVEIRAGVKKFHD